MDDGLELFCDDKMSELVQYYVSFVRGKKMSYNSAALDTITSQEKKLDFGCCIIQIKECANEQITVV